MRRGVVLGVSLYSCMLLTACGDDGGAAATDSATGTASTTAGTSATSMSSTTMATESTTTASTGPTTTTTTTSTTGTTGTTGNVEPPEGTFYVFVSSNGNEVTTWSMDSKTRTTPAHATLVSPTH